MSSQQVICQQSLSTSVQDPENAFSRVGMRLVLSAHLNAAHTLFGGLIVQWVDEAASIFVMDVLKNRSIVTKKISEVIYNEPARLGDVLEFLLRVKSVGRTSITVECVVMAKDIDREETPRCILNCYLVFVKIDKFGKPSPHHYVKGSDLEELS